MKVIWITNILFSHFRTMVGLNFDNRGSGSWLYAAYDALKCNNNIQLHIITVSSVNKLVVDEFEGSFFYILPSKYNQNEWDDLITSISPDVAIVWGTESYFAYDALKAMSRIPTAIYMQGVINSIYEHYFDGLPHKYRIKTIRDYADLFLKDSNFSYIKKQKDIETEMLKLASAVIVENDWCEDVCLSINPRLKVFKNQLPVKKEFYEYTWNFTNIEPYSIFTNAGGYPIKGHHILFQALGVVKQAIPNVKCYVPGVKLNAMGGIRRETGYSSFLKQVIRTNNLEDNIQYVGSLTSTAMADYLSKSNIYVMPSVMENHSSSLIEAMIVGTPSISSFVGGTATLIEHKYNGLHYNSTDVQSLAGAIVRMLRNNDFACEIHRNALKTRQLRKTNFGDEIINICNDIIK